MDFLGKLQIKHTLHLFKLSSFSFPRPLTSATAAQREVVGGGEKQWEWGAHHSGMCAQLSGNQWGRSTENILGNEAAALKHRLPGEHAETSPTSGIPFWHTADPDQASTRGRRTLFTERAVLPCCIALPINCRSLEQFLLRFEVLFPICLFTGRCYLWDCDAAECSPLLSWGHQNSVSALH